MKMREIVIPGEKISDKKMKIGQGAYMHEGKIFSSLHGIVVKSKDFVKVVPLRGRYIPHRGDHVIGIVEATRFGSCFVDLNSPYNGYLSLDRDGELKVGDLILVKVNDVTSVNKTTLEYPKKLYDGKLLEIEPVKIPRVIGKKGSMLNILKDSTGTLIFVGRNGRIFIKGDRKGIIKVEAALKMIEKEAHTLGLTSRVKKFLETKEGKK